MEMPEGWTLKPLLFCCTHRASRFHFHFCEACPSTYLHTYLQQSFHISHIQNIITGSGFLDSDSPQWVSPGLWGPFDLRPLSLSYWRHYSLRHTGPLWPWRGEQQRWGGLWCWNDAEVMLRFAQCAWMPRTKAGPVHALVWLWHTGVSSSRVTHHTVQRFFQFFSCVNLSFRPTCSKSICSFQLSAPCYYLSGCSALITAIFTQRMRLLEQFSLKPSRWLHISRLKPTKHQQPFHQSLFFSIRLSLNL